MQDSFKLSQHVNVNYGVRYELFGAPDDAGTKDTLIQLGSGSNLAQQLTSASLGPGTQVFKTDKKDWAVRAGASYDLFGNAHTLMRGGFGIFYDRPFDNLWENVRNNNLILPLITLNASQMNYLAPIATQLQTISAKGLSSNFPDLTLIDPNLQNGRVYSYFAGVAQRLSDRLTLEVNGLGSYGRNLITTDIVNRDDSVATGRYNPNLPDIAYRGGQGFSDYNALAAVLRYRANAGMLQATYTWSHAIDNQSEPLLGDFFNLTFTSVGSSGGSSARTTFSEQFNPNADRGDSDFDQRHNLVLFGYWNLPALGASKFAGFTRGFVVSALSAFRSGFPYTVLGTSNAIEGQGEILSNRPNLIDPAAAVLSQPVPVAGGKKLLNPAAFANAAASMLGTAGRNEFIGPGFYNLDVSLARSFAIREGIRLTARASAFNVLNHANLNNPDTLFTSPTFGVALFGRQGVQSGFPATAPLNETPRQVQLSLKLEF